MGSILAPCCNPNSIEKRAPNFMNLLTHLGTDFGSFGFQLGSQNSSKIDPGRVWAKGAPRSMPGSLRSLKRLPKHSPSRAQGLQNPAFGHPKSSKLELQTSKMETQITPEFRKRSLAQNFKTMQMHMKYYVKQISLQRRNPN